MEKIRSGSAGRKLQRGRRLETTESALLAHDVRAELLDASTGPSSGDDGEEDGAELGVERLDVASTGPSSGDDGEGAWTVHPRYGRQLLQRGRRLETTESTRRSCGRLARSTGRCFNGAVVWRRRRDDRWPNGGRIASGFNGAVVWRRRRGPVRW